MTRLPFQELSTLARAERAIGRVAALREMCRALEAACIQNGIRAEDLKEAPTTESSVSNSYYLILVSINAWLMHECCAEIVDAGITVTELNIRLQAIARVA